MGRAKGKIAEKKLSSRKLLDDFRRRLAKVRAASRLKRVQEDVCGRKVSLGSFLEAQGVFDPELLRQVFIDLSGEIHTSWGDARLAHLTDKLKLVDGTLLPALPGMHRALWLNEENRAAKLHLKF